MVFAMRVGAYALLAVAVFCAGCQRTAPPPIVLLVSLDGFRSDYLERLDLPALEAIAARGVRAEGLVPVFPSVTFPNHYSLVTGLRPARHGIVSNNIVDPDIEGRFSLSERQVQKDPRWWGGEPLWLTGSKHGQRSAPYFWPGAEVAIQGRYADYWEPFDDDLSAAQRVDRVIDWLMLPEPDRPAFLTLYFSDTDHAGHDFGPASPELAAAAQGVDREVGRLDAAVTQMGLASRFHWVIASDHGMAPLSAERVIVLDDFLDPSTIDIVDQSPWLTMFPGATSADDAYAALKDRHDKLAIYRRDDMPESWGLRGHARVPPIVGLVSEGWMLATRAWLAEREPGRPWGGAHGFDPESNSMRGVLIAAGPSVRAGQRIGPVQNVDVYNVICRILGWTPATNDGDRKVADLILR